MRLEGYITETNTSVNTRHFELNVPTLNIILYSSSLEEGFFSLKKHIYEILSSSTPLDYQNFITIRPTKENNFEIICKDTKIMVAFILKKLRIKNNITIRQLAAKMHSGHPNSVYQYESGACVAGFQKFQELVNLMGHDFKISLVKEEQEESN